MPHSERGSITSSMRGIIVDKLNIELRYDTDIVSAGQRLAKMIYPVKLISFKPISDYKGGGSTGPSFSPGILPDGENGIVLVVRDGGRETRMKLSLQIISQQTD